MSERFRLTSWDPALVAPPIPWMIDRLWLGKGKVQAVFGAEKSGKSRLVSWMLASLFAGVERCLGQLIIPAHRPQRVLWLRGEEDQADLQDRIKGYMEVLGVEGARERKLPLDFLEAMGLQLDRGGTKEGKRDWFWDRFVRPQTYDLIVMDPLRRLHAGDENDNSRMSEMHNAFRWWVDKFRTALLPIHHTGKLREEADMERIATWSRGNTDLPTLVDGALFVHPIRDTKKYRKLKVLRAGRKYFGSPLLIDDLREGDDEQGFWLAQTL